MAGSLPPRRSDGGLFRTDQGNLVLNSRFGPITEPAALSAALQARAGIIEHGLFIGIAQDLFVAGTSGVRHVRRGDHDAIAAVFAARLPEPR